MFILPKLDYSYDSLEPFVDTRTMEIHYSKHHQTYIDKLNETLKDYPQFLEMDINDLLKNVDKIPEIIRQKVINFAGGHANHTFFWQVIGPKNDHKPIEKILALKEEFNQKALGLFGSGWTWIVKNGSLLEVMNTQNQDSPILLGKEPVLTIDLWEHAFYLKHQNRKFNYINNFWEIVNWSFVEKLI